jgi:nucleoid-associated protein YgaU
MPRKAKAAPKQSLNTSFTPELNSASSYLNLVLGLLIVLVVGVLLFNYFKKDGGDLGPSDQTASTTGQEQKDVEVSNLPGKYTVKEGDTLFTIAEKYYSDGYQYLKLVETNKLSDANNLTVGQVLEIPKLETTPVVAQIQPTGEAKGGIGGAENQTIWGERITGDTYVTVEGDWLSKIAGRAYGDPMKFDVIAKANNISNADLIPVGITLKIPRQ